MRALLHPRALLMVRAPAPLRALLALQAALQASFISFPACGLGFSEIVSFSLDKKLNFPKDKIILDECSTVVEIDHVINRKTA